jgi:hypothetical protein
LLVAFDFVNNTLLQVKLLQLEKDCVHGTAATDSQTISERRSLPPGQTNSNPAPTMLIQTGETRSSWKTLHPNKTSNMASPVCFVKQSFYRLAYNNHVDKLLRLLCSLL